MILPRVHRNQLVALLPNEYHLVVFDPGGTIGWAHFIIHARAFSRPEHKVLANLISWDCGEFSGQEHEQLGEASRLIYRAHFDPPPFNTRTDAVSEDFELTQTIGGKNLLSPVRINAVLDWECRKQGLRLQTQARQMRRSVTPERLVLFGFHPPGKRWTTTGKGKDAFAAMQHAIVWVRRVKEKSIAQPWKLADGQSKSMWDCQCNRGRRCDLVHP